MRDDGLDDQTTVQDGKVWSKMTAKVGTPYCTRPGVRRYSHTGRILQLNKSGRPSMTRQVSNNQSCNGHRKEAHVAWPCLQRQQNAKELLQGTAEGKRSRGRPVNSVVMFCGQYAVFHGVAIWRHRMKQTYVFTITDGARVGDL